MWRDRNGGGQKRRKAKDNSRGSERSAAFRSYGDEGSFSHADRVLPANLEVRRSARHYHEGVPQMRREWKGRKLEAGRRILTKCKMVHSSS